jgi:hypothetical protein
MSRIKYHRLGNALLERLEVHAALPDASPGVKLSAADVAEIVEALHLVEWLKWRCAVHPDRPLPDIFA